MSNKTLIPAFQCKVGDWNYYICTMKYGEVARQVNFAYEMGGNTQLGQLIQRGITNRTEGITEYLKNSEHRFLNGLVIAAWGGVPQYTPLMMDDPDGMLKGLDQGFGVLTFDGTQNYFVLDGQHRLKAIKDAIKEKPSLLTDDICVLIVTHYDSPEGRIRTRRLFSNINRNAKQTGVAENIALDEDDGIAVITRRLLEEHPFLKHNGRVRVILSTNDSGGVKLATNSIPKTDAKALTSMTVLYDLVGYLAYDCSSEIHSRSKRPSDDVLESTYATVSERLDELFKHCGNVRVKLEAAVSARDLRAPKNAEEKGHAFMRPIVQKAVASVLSELIQQGLATWDELMERLEQLAWQLNDCPWVAVATVDGRMLTSKDNSELLRELLRAHLAPSSLQSIKRARQNFKKIRNVNYPVSEDELAKRIVQSGTTRLQSSVFRPIEISDPANAKASAASADENVSAFIESEDDEEFLDDSDDEI